MLILILGLICAITLSAPAADASEIERIQLNMPAFLAGARSGELELQLGGQNLVLEVEPTTIWGDDLKAYAGIGTDRYEVPFARPSMFAGRVRGYVNSDVRLTISSTTAWVNGYVMVDGNWRFIEPVEVGGAPREMREHVLSGPSRPDEMEALEAALDLRSVTSESAVGGDSRTGLYLTPVGDHEYYAIDPATWHDRLAAQIGNIAGLFLNTLNISFEVLEIYIDIQYSSSNGDELMSQLVADFQYIDEDRRHIVHLLTGRNLIGDNLGLSRNGLGRHSGYSLAQMVPDTYYNADAWQMMLVSTHEVGHNFDAQHDLGESYYIWWDVFCVFTHYSIMWPQFDGACSEGIFSQANINVMEGRDNILDDYSPPPATIVVEYADEYATTLDLFLWVETPNHGSGDEHVIGVSEDADPYPLPAVPADPSLVTIFNITMSPGDGERTVYAHVKDAADNLRVVTDTIIIDTTAPSTVAALASASHVVGEPSALAEVLVSWEAATDQTSGLAGYSILWSQSPVADPDDTVNLPADALAQTSDPLSDGEWYFSIMAKDNVDWMGSVERIGPFVIDSLSGVEDGEGSESERFFVSQNHPNPFNPVTEISFGLPQDERVSVKIYNAFGKMVRTLLDRELSAGRHSIVWEGRDDQGKQLSSGVFFYRIQAGDRTVTRKLTLMK